MRSVTVKIKSASGFTIVELMIVVALIGILAGLVVVSYNGWQTSIAEKEVRSDLTTVVSAMKSQRNFNNEYPLAIPSTFKGSANVDVDPTEMSKTAFCIDGTSLSLGSVTMFVREDGIVKKGSCLGGEIVPGVGSTWTARPIAPSATLWRSVTKGNGLFVAVGTNAGGQSTRATSPDGITWTARSGGEAESVVYGNGLFVAVDDTYGASTSPDGITWTSRSVPVASWEEVTYANGLFVAVGLSGATMTSPDGITWTSRTAPSAAWSAITYGNGLFVAASRTSTGAMTSPDGITWTSRTMPGGSHEAVIFANNMFVAVGSNRVSTSPDGITWTSRAAASNLLWYSLTYGSNMFVAVGNSGGLMSSTDGITWTARTAPELNSWHSVTYMNGKFVAVATSGTNRVMTSP